MARTKPPGVERHEGSADRIAVTGPAVVRMPGEDYEVTYEITTSITLVFPAESEVWLRAWPEDET